MVLFWLAAGSFQGLPGSEVHYDPNILAPALPMLVLPVLILWLQVLCLLMLWNRSLPQTDSGFSFLLTIKYLLDDIVDGPSEWPTLFHRKLLEQISLQHLLVQFFTVGNLKCHASQYLFDMVTGFVGSHITGCLILLICLPSSVPKQRKLAGQITDGFQITLHQPEHGIGLQQGNR